jgi:hypothetical protein
MKELGREARRLLELTRRQDDPGVGIERRVKQALVARMASAQDAAAGTPRPRFTATANTVAKSVVVLTAVGALLGVGQLGRKRSRSIGSEPSSVTGLEQRREPVQDRSPAEARTASSAAVQEQPAEREPTAAATPRSSHKQQLNHQAPRRTTPDGLQAEIADLRAVQRALRNGDGTTALDLLDRQDTVYAHGALQEERAAARVLALCEAGSVTQARTQATRFERRWPGSALVARVRSSCGGRDP